MNTHSRWADCRMELMAAAALRAGIEGPKAAALLESVTTDDALGKCTPDERVLIMNQIMKKIEEYMNYRTEGKLMTGAMTFSGVYGILGKTDRADELIESFKRERGL